nr:MAG TPA: hypothetical protein [Caudoviricetes sp.]
MFFGLTSLFCPFHALFKPRIVPMMPSYFI